MPAVLAKPLPFAHARAHTHTKHWFLLCILVHVFVCAFVCVALLRGLSASHLCDLLMGVLSSSLLLFFLPCVRQLFGAGVKTGRVDLLCLRALQRCAIKHLKQLSERSVAH